ncbi:putative signal transducing protein [Alteromonas sp. ASW11-130]|uniref:putative signal transducing protein n=1 Tax=Alteromonas sp. ASW11-130 TaxID=3015775 RepID=UPI002241995D|nr:DUF2007 domain-containing protein [Alteromonas sp. ASW11-130]MCW8091761.1 DUF2007 domain-containing protein [Alteromonas sp. ASW11-130]
MKKLFSSDDRFLVQQVRSELEALDIPYLMKNEFTSGAMGELPWQDVMPEIWLIDEEWEPKARELVFALVEHTKPGEDKVCAQLWRCPHCQEMNEPEFDVCWQCEGEPRVLPLN